MILEVGTWLQPKNEEDRDGTLTRIDNVVVKNKMLYRVYGVDVCEGIEMSSRMILSKDIDNWVEVEMVMLYPSTL